jgi:hypothetical protein
MKARKKRRFDLEQRIGHGETPRKQRERTQNPEEVLLGGRSGLLRSCFRLVILERRLRIGRFRGWAFAAPGKLFVIFGGLKRLKLRLQKKKKRTKGFAQGCRMANTVFNGKV